MNHTAFIENVAQNPQIAVDLLNACREAAKVHNSTTLLGCQLHAAVAMAELGHTPRRPLAELLEREAAMPVFERKNPCDTEGGAL